MYKRVEKDEVSEKKYFEKLRKIYKVACTPSFFFFLVFGQAKALLFRHCSKHTAVHMKAGDTAFSGTQTRQVLRGWLEESTLRLRALVMFGCHQP